MAADSSGMENRTKFFVSKLVAELDSLPTLAAQVVSLASDPHCDLRALTRLILSDNVLTMRFLALANSAALFHGQEIKDLRGALVRLGIGRVRNVALLMGMHDMAPAAETASDLDLKAYWQYSLATASCAQGLALHRGSCNHEDAWVVGILHGLGVTSLTQHTGQEFHAVIDFARQQNVSLAEAEMRVLDFHHGELGARILKEWHLPRVFAEAIEFYPESFEADEISAEATALIDILRDAITTARAIGYGESGDYNPTTRMKDLGALLNLDDATLNKLAADVDHQVQEMSRLIGLSVPENLFMEALEVSRQEVARVGLEGLDAALVKENLENQMQAARAIQQQILPQFVPHIPGFEMAAINHPSRAVSGDTYDFLTFASGSRGVVIADVSGKGIPAALLASTIQASLRALAKVTDDPGKLLGAANRALFESTDDERFATLFLGVISPDGHQLHYANAGHNPPLLRRSDGQQEWLKPAGAPLGMMPEMSYPGTRMAMAAGDILVTYTDGLTEAADSQGREFGAAGLLENVVNNAHHSPAKIVEILKIAVGQHTTAGSDAANSTDSDKVLELDDDLTMVVLKKS